MITTEQANQAVRTRKPELVAELANELKIDGTPIESHWPVQTWEAHPVVSKYLDELKDREIAAAIDLSKGV